MCQKSKCCQKSIVETFKKVGNNLRIYQSIMIFSTKFVKLYILFLTQPSGLFTVTVTDMKATNRDYMLQRSFSGEPPLVNNVMSELRHKPTNLDTNFSF